MQKTKIEWTDYSWSPVVGCKNNCFYCYGKRLNNRFKWIKDWTQPKFYPERLKEPYKIKKPSKIFVCSMADLFGDWIPTGWIHQIIQVAVGNPQHTFQFLTKNPKRYDEFIFTKNCWLGITAENYESSIGRVHEMEYLKWNEPEKYIFASVEPILSGFPLNYFEKFDLVIIGAMTGTGAIKPKREWIYSIKHNNIFFKNNIKLYL